MICFLPCQGCAAGTTTTTSSGISSLYSTPRWERRAPTMPSSARPSATQSTAVWLSPIRSVMEMSGYLSLNRPIMEGSTYSPGMVLAPTRSSPLMRPWKPSIAWRASRASASMRCA